MAEISHRGRSRNALDYSELRSSYTTNYTTKRMRTGKKYLAERIIERRETHFLSHIFESFIAFVNKYIYDRSLNNCKELLAVNLIVALMFLFCRLNCTILDYEYDKNGHFGKIRQLNTRTY